MLFKSVLIIGALATCCSAHAQEHRERVELLDLLDRATPHEIKSGGQSWYHSLREDAVVSKTVQDIDETSIVQGTQSLLPIVRTDVQDGTRFIGVGNMFSG
eukprot:763331-Amphidinium_carterae.1